MKGFTKAMQRTPHLFTSTVGMSTKSSDPEFDEMNRKFTTMEKACESLLKDAVIYRSNVQGMLQSQQEFAKGFSTILQPMGSDEDAYGSESREHLQANLAALDFYATHMAELRESLQPEIDLIDTRVIAPARELQGLMKNIRKSITKRDHKLLDYDRHNNSLKKLKDKNNKTLKDEQNLFKYESDFEAATAEYEHYSSLLKTDLPRFFQLVAEFMYPLSTSLFFMQLNIYYLSAEKFRLVNDELERQNIATPGTGSTMSSILEVYNTKRGSAPEDMEQLLCIRGAKSTSVFMRQYNDRNGESSGGAGARPSSMASRPSYSKSDSFGSKGDSSAGAPPVSRYVPPSSRTSAAAAPPPAYTAPAAGAASNYGAATKRAPPPPPPLANKPKPPTQYVIALYDYAAQAGGDLSFSAGDRIELVKRTDSENDWWTGKLNGQQGIFPGNYVQMA